MNINQSFNKKKSHWPVCSPMVVVSKAKTSLIVSLLLQVNNPRQDSTSLGLEWQVEMM